MQTKKNTTDTISLDSDDVRFNNISLENTVKYYKKNKWKNIKKIKKKKYRTFFNFFNTVINDFSHSPLGYFLLIYLLATIFLLITVPIFCYGVPISNVLIFFACILVTPSIVINITSVMEYVKRLTVLIKDHEIQHNLQTKLEPEVEKSPILDDMRLRYYNLLNNNINLISQIGYTDYEQDLLFLQDLADKILTGSETISATELLNIVRDIEEKAKGNIIALHKFSDHTEPELPTPLIEEPINKPKVMVMKPKDDIS